MQIQLLTPPSPAERACLGEGIGANNRDTIPGFAEVSETLRFVVLARDSAGAETGGMRAAGYGRFPTIERPWLSEPARGCGIDRSLVARAEAFALARGFCHARGETTFFRARPFCQRLGYEAYGVLQDVPPGHGSHTLKQATWRRLIAADACRTKRVC